MRNGATTLVSAAATNGVRNGRRNGPPDGSPVPSTPIQRRVNETVTFSDGRRRASRGPSSVTVSASTYRAARRAWDAGEFGDEWRDIRQLAAAGGILYPPSGTAFDSWEDDRPSQRAVLARAIAETPELLGRCIIGARSWAAVIARLLQARDAWRAELRADGEPVPDGPGRDEAAAVWEALERRLPPAEEDRP